MTARHRHTSSFFSSLGHMLHFGSHLPSSTLLPASQTSERVHNYDDFEANLAQRLMLLLPEEGTAFLSAAAFRQAMSVLLETLSDLRALLPQLKLSLTPAQQKMIQGFLERSGSLFDECNAVREAVLEVQRWQGIVQAVLRLLGEAEGHVIEAHIRRSWKLLRVLIHTTDEEKEIEAHEQPFRHRSFRWSSWHSAEFQEPQRWNSWHGTANHQARPLSNSLAFPKYTDTEMADCFMDSLYGFHIITTFFLRIIMAALPCKSKSLVLSVSHPRHFLWARPHLNLQERALDEIRKTGRSSTDALLWELFQILSRVRQLFEFTEKTLDVNSFPLSAELQEEMKQIIRPLRHKAMELETDLEPFYQQVTEFYQCLVTTHFELLDLLRS